ncbi:MAG: low temperature requirement protein A [Solirubrobacteraceae bacterium]
MTTGAPPREGPRLAATLRGEDERVTPLELFFDLVFVLALTQCTALMAAEPTWEGFGKAALVLAMLWWSWSGYAWLTSVVDPEDDVVRLTIFAAMTAFLMAALAVPRAFEDDALVFAAAYAVVRAAHIALFWLASREDPGLRTAVTGLGISTLLASGLLAAASATDGTLQALLWLVALVVDIGVPLLLIDADGWRMVPQHFAERFGLIVIIALGESIVAIGVGVESGITLGVAAAAVLAMIVAAALWWMYFDVVALVAAKRLENAAPGRERNSIGRDSYGILHLPMIAGIVFIALGFKKTLGHVDEHLKVETATALLGGTSAYLLAHVAFRWRNIHTLNRQRLAMSVVLVALIPLAVEISALATLGMLTVLLAGLVAYERVHFRGARNRLRERLLHPVAEPECL